MDVVPGPTAPSAVQFARLLRNPVGFLRGAHREHGDVFRVKLPTMPPIAYVADPELARVALGTDGREATTGQTRALLFEPLVGSHSLLTLDGESWERERALVGPAFHGGRIESFGERIASIAAERIEAWPSGVPFALRDRMREITLEVILRLVFGISDGPRHDELRSLLPDLVEAGSWYAWTPGVVRGLLERVGHGGPAGRLNPARRILELRERVDRLLYAEIAERRGQEDLDQREDVLSTLLCAEGERDDEALRDELMTLLAAGHETTSTALAWAFERLTRTPDVMELLTEEALGDGTGEFGSYLDAVVKETIRARPVVVDVARMLQSPLRLGARTIPSGWMLAPAIVVLHHREDIWGDPERFRPERFLDDPPLEAWIPFGGGRRRCVGSHLAQLEMKMVIREVLRRRRMRAADPEPERPRLRHVTLVPEQGARVVATKA